MKKIQNILMIAFLVCFAINGYAQDNMLCQDAYWTEDQANIIMKKWAGEWKTKADWEKRADVIRQGIIKGMKFDQMPKVSNEFNTIIRNTHTMHGYIVENIAIESFPGFYITGNLYRPLKADKKLSLIHISEPTRLGMISYAVF